MVALAPTSVLATHMPPGVLALSVEPEVETPAILNGWRPRDADKDVPAAVLFPSKLATTSP